MRAHLLLAASFVPIISLSQLAAQEAPASPPTSDQPASGLPAKEERHPGVKHLTDVQLGELQDLLKDASEYVRGVRVTECIETCSKAIALAPDFYISYNLRGAAYTKLRDFEKAKADFIQANKLEPKAFDVRFNLAEMDFVTEKHESSLKQFEKLLNDHPEIPQQQEHLIKYKILICRLFTGDTEGAKTLAGEFSYTDNTPAHYYSRAAIEYAAGNDVEGQNWVRSAANIFPTADNQNYLDSLIESKWVTSLGSGVETEEE